MSVVALRSGRYRVEKGALVFVGPFVGASDKCHGNSAVQAGPTNAMAFREAS